MTRWLILLILTVALSHLMALLACEPGEQNGPPETDRKALVALYNATDGPN